MLVNISNMSSFFDKKWNWRAVERSALRRSLRELSNENLDAKPGFDTADENEPSKVRNCHVGNSGTKKSRTGILVFFVPLYRYEKYRQTQAPRSQQNNYAIPIWHVSQMLSEYDASLASNPDKDSDAYNQATCRADHHRCVYKVQCSF